jgi:transposase
MADETGRIVLTPDEQKELQRLMRSPKAQQRQALRASIVWYLAVDGMHQAEVAAKLNITRKTVAKWEGRFLDKRLRGLGDLPRSGAPTRFSVEQRCQVLSIACAAPGDYGLDGQTCWTLDTLTEAVRAQGIAMGRSTVARTLERNDLKPHKMRMWLHSPDPAFREKVNEIVSLYLAPPKDAVILCVDEKTGMQATERKYATKCPKPGRPGRYEYEYIRHGTQSLLASFDIIKGRVVARCGSTRTADDLLAFMEHVAAEYRKAKKVIVVWDNLNIHHDGPSKRWTEFNERHGGKFEFRYTPLHASWVNQVEIFFSILHRRCLKHGSFPSVENLQDTVLDFIRRWNEKDGHAFDWCFRGYPIQSQAKAVA